MRSGKRRRTELLVVRLLPAELAQIKAEAKRSKITVAEFVRRRTLWPDGRCAS